MTMYAMNRLCRKSQDFIFSFVGTARSRSDSFSFAMACVLINAMETAAYNANETPDEHYFVRTYGIKLVGKLNDLNEMLKLDIDKVLYYTAKLYQYRQSQTCWNGWMNVVHSKETAIADFFGITRFFSKEDLAIIEKDHVSILTDILNLTQLTTEIGFFDGKPNDQVT